MVHIVRLPDAEPINPVLQGRHVADALADLHGLPGASLAEIRQYMRLLGEDVHAVAKFINSVREYRDGRG